MKNSLPRLLLISEATLDEKATGLNRTLFNLLASYSMEDFMLFSQHEQLEKCPPAHPFGDNVACFSQWISLPWRNRISAWISPWINLLNLQITGFLSIPDFEKILSFDPEVVLICPDSPVGLVMGYRLVQRLKLPFVIYFMDDWVVTNHQRWLTGGTQLCCRELLENAKGWITISPQLKQSLVSRYATSPRKSLVAHNPVELSGKVPPSFEPHRQKVFRIAYAGSIHTMHYDAVASVAESVAALQIEGYDVELVLYTQPDFWNRYRQAWEKYKVVYGGFLPYEAVGQHLRQADLLLVASSFLPRYVNITRSSVQTKITDYMATGRTIFSYGPAYAACNLFVKEWLCGLVFETNDLEKLNLFLADQIKKREINQIYARTAYRVLQENFAAEKVVKKFFAFIQNCTYGLIEK